MKKLFILAVLFCFGSLAVSAQGFYFDIGLGIGKAWTYVDGYDFFEEIKDVDDSVSEVGVELGLKAGYGPFGSIPLYVVGEFGGLGHRITDNSSYYMQFNTYIIGPGVIFYPISLIQLGASLGVSFTGNMTDLEGVYMYDSMGGFAWNLSAAVDLGKGNHGCLIGIKYFGAYNKLETSYAEEQSSFFGVFVRYTYRHKVK